MLEKPTITVAKNHKLKWIFIIKSFLFIYALTFMIGFLSEIVGWPYDIFYLKTLNFIAIAVTFFVIGYFSNNRTANNFIMIALLAWLSGSINIVLIDTPITAWLIDLPLIMACMMMGYIASSIKKRMNAQN